MGKMGGRGTELRLRRRRDLRRGARRWRGRPDAVRVGTRAGHGPDAGMHRQQPGGCRCGRSTRDCGRRARRVPWYGPWTATSGTTSAGPRPGSSRRCSRPALLRGTGSWDGRYVAATAALVWQAAGRENFVEDVQAMRRRVEGPSVQQVGRTATETGSRGACATSSSASNCCRWCMVGATTWCEAPTRCARWRHWPTTDTSAARTPRDWRAPIGSCAHWSTGCSCTGCNAHTWYPRATRTASGGPFTGLPHRPGKAVRRQVAGSSAARCAACTRSCSTGRCCRPWPGWNPVRPADSGCAGDRLEALGFTDPVSALRHLEALPPVSLAAPRSRRRCCRCCSGGSRRAPIRTRRCWGSARSATRSVRPLGICACCVTSRRRRTAWPTSWARAGTPRDLLMRAPEAVSMLAEGTQLTTRTLSALESEAMASVPATRTP